MALLAVGIGTGYVVRGRDSAEVSQLRGEVYNMRQLVALSLLQQQSASDRLRGVNFAYHVEQADPQVLSALLTTVNHDPSVNVRLAAVDALRNFNDSPVGRNGLVQALARQDSPLVQIAILDQIVELHERSAVSAIQFLLSGQNVNPDVRQRAQWALKQLQ
jgi:HEAT repeat protein